LADYPRVAIRFQFLIGTLKTLECERFEEGRKPMFQFLIGTLKTLEA